jgi:hypothetical protein
VIGYVVGVVFANQSSSQDYAVIVNGFNRNWPVYLVIYDELLSVFDFLSDFLGSRDWPGLYDITRSRMELLSQPQRARERIDLLLVRVVRRRFQHYMH